MIDASRYFTARELRQFAELARDFRKLVLEDDRDPTAVRRNRPERHKIADCLVAMMTEVLLPPGQAVQLDDFVFYTTQTPNGAVDLAYCFLPALVLKGA